MTVIAAARVLVRMRLTEQDALELSRLIRASSPIASEISDQLWLRAALIEARLRLPRASRSMFDRRADLILGRLDP